MIDIEDCRSKQEGIYLFSGKLWKVHSFCEGPSVKMVALGDAENTIDFGLGGQLNSNFRKVDDLRWDYTTRSLCSATKK